MAITTTTTEESVPTSAPPASQDANSVQTVVQIAHPATPTTFYTN